MYNPSIGRFMQTDPIGYTSDLDLYAYVYNNPIDGTDPSGECASAAVCLASQSARNLAAGIAYAANTQGTLAESKSVVSVIVNRAMSDEAQYGCKAGSCSVKDVVSKKGQFGEYASRNFKSFEQGGVHNTGSGNAKDAAAYLAKHGQTTKATYYIENAHGAAPSKHQLGNLGNVRPSKPAHVGGVHFNAALAESLPQLFGQFASWAEQSLLARLMFAESAGVSSAYSAVGWSIVNRVGTPGFPGTLSSVIYEPGQFASIGQPLWNAAGDPIQLAGLNAVSYAQALGVAGGILNGAIPDPTGGAEYFYSGGTPSGWFQNNLNSGTLTPTYSVGPFTFLVQH